MTTLIVSTMKLRAEQALADAAARLGWKTIALDDAPDAGPEGRVVCYVSTEHAMATARRLGLVLLEPPLGLLAKLPEHLVRREVKFVRFQDLSRLKRKTFVKPADPLHKCFDVGTYSNPREIRAPRCAPHGIAPETPVLISEPVEFLAEFRCFVCEGQVVASSPYLSFGRPNWKHWGQGGEKAVPSRAALDVCARLLKERSVTLPPAFVVDVGLIDERGWAVVEFNPAWSSGILGADPASVLRVLERACQSADLVTADDARWIVGRASDPAKLKS